MPIVFVTVCALLIVVPCYVAPYEVFMGLIITVAGIPVYYMGVVWKDKPIGFQAAISKSQYDHDLTICFIVANSYFSTTDAVTIFCQKFFLSAKEETD